MRKSVLLFFVPFIFSSAFPVCAAENYSDSQIRRILIRESLLRYPGKCPCPYSKKADGSSCGAESAYKGAGEGYAVLCYETDVGEGAIQRYRQKNLQKYQAPKEVVNRPGKRPEKKPFWENF